MGHSNADMVGVELLARADVQVGGDRPWDIEIHDERFFERVLRDRELGLGESYQDSWWDSPAVDQFLAKVIAADLRSSIRRSPKLLARAAYSTFTNRQGRRGAKRNARAHYDIGNDLFERMLDARMVYSCAYWRDADTLDAAQVAKLELICRKLHLRPGMRVLDIGCGWGGFARYAAEKHDVEVVGITPAAEQAEWARDVCMGLPVRIEQCDYREATGEYDRVLSVGMMEHVGARNHRKFFEICGRRLAPRGIMLHHMIGGNVTTTGTDAWFDRYVFPGGVLPTLRQIGRATEPDWVIEDLHNFGPDYDRTLLQWHDNIEAAWEDLPGYDERFRRTWRYYLLTSAAGFRTRHVQLFQMVFRRSDEPSEVYDSVR